MNIANVTIGRVIAHEVVRATQLVERPPLLSDHLIALDERGKSLLGKRLVATVASGSHCVDVMVDDSSDGSPFARATAMLDLDDAAFVESSKHLAQGLSNAQTAGSIKAGCAIFAEGTCFADSDAARFVAIIKADSDQGFYRETRGEMITLQYASDMVLGESQRLIKIAFFIEHQERDAVRQPVDRTARHADDFSIKVFDHMMQNSGNGEAAAYFYSSFLRCRLAESAPRKTKHFYDTARAFIEEMSISSAEKVDLRGDLIAHLRGNRSTLEPRTFAREVLPLAHQDAFLIKCREAGIDQAVTKDLALLKGKLRHQSLRFSSKVTLYAPPDVFRQSVRIIGSQGGWTELKILGDIEAVL